MESFVACGLFAAVDKLNGQPAVEIRKFAQADFHRVVIEIERLENFGIGIKLNRRAGAVGRADFLQRTLRDAPVENLFVYFAVLVNGGFQPFGQCVHAGYADAVQSARDFIAAAAEFSAGVQLRQNDFNGGFALFRDNARGDSAAVIDDFAAAVLFNRNDDFVAVSGKSLVDTVVDDFRNKVMQAPFVGRADVHTRSFTDGIQPFEDLYRALVVR